MRGPRPPRLNKPLASTLAAMDVQRVRKSRWLTTACLAACLLASDAAAQENTAGGRQPSTAPTEPPVKFIGSVRIPPDAVDASGLTETIAGGIPHNRLGGIGSAIEWIGGDEYILLPDRGPIDGASPYRTRIQWMLLKPSQEGGLFSVLSTSMLRSENGKNLVGLAREVDPASPLNSLRYDPEGVRRLPSGRVLVSEEYGPSIDEFSEDGKRTGRWPVPDALRPSRYGPKESDELPPSCTHGRQPNRGLEGIAVTPAGRVVAILQSPLIQDHGLDESGKRVGSNIRMVVLDPSTGASAQYVYRLESPSLGVSEILAVDESRFLVIERDGKAGESAKVKKIMLADITDATDVSGHESLPEDNAGAGIKAAVKREVLDLLGPSLGLRGKDFPEKVEGLTFGRPQPDGALTLVVSTDNDFKDTPTWVWFFAVDRSVLDAGGAR